MSCETLESIISPTKKEDQFIRIENQLQARRYEGMTSGTSTQSSTENQKSKQKQILSPIHLSKALQSIEKNKQFKHEANQQVKDLKKTVLCADKDDNLKCDSQESQLATNQPRNKKLKIVNQ